MPDFPDLAQTARRQQQIDEAVARMRLLNSQLEVFHATRRILDEHPRSTSPAVKQIRELYAAFDKKHPAQKDDDQ